MNETNNKQEVCFPNGRRIFATEDKRVMYSEDALHGMVSAGYIVKVDGKRWRGIKKERNGKTGRE